MLHRIGLIVATTLLSLVMMAQGLPEAEINKELERRSLTRTEVEAALAEKGIDLSTVNINNPEELAKTRKEVESVLAELEAKKKAQKPTASSGNSTLEPDKPKPTAQEAADAIRKKPMVKDAEVLEAVKEGATIEEAINEEVQEAKQGDINAARTYGHHLYRDQNIQFYKRSTDAKPPRTYILGPGDGIAIEIWGVAEASMAFQINADGYIKPDRIPRIYLSGLTIAQAEELLKDRFSNYYPIRGDRFEVNVSTARTINVNISGEVFDAGNYNISALNNAINALVAAGGPTDLGSVRNIKLIQSGKTQTIDLYQYLLDPSIETNYYLAENDYIVVPVAQKVVELRGAVNRPYRYELLTNENLKELISYAGGLQVDALKRNIKIQRIENDMEVILNVNLAEVLEGKKRFDLKNGDIITVVSIPNEYRNVVSVRGAVEVPGEYAFEEGMRIGDLLDKAGLEESAILDIAYVIRLKEDLKNVEYIQVDLNPSIKSKGSEDDLVLRRGDVLQVRSLSNFADQYTFSIDGSVRIEGEFPISVDNIKLSDAIFLAGGATYDASDYAYIIRQEPGETQPTYLVASVEGALSIFDDSKDVSILPGDRIRILSKASLTEDFEVSISGEVRNPGTFRYGPNFTLKELILLAGGAKYEADLSQIDIFRMELDGDSKTRTLVANVQIDKNYNVVSGDEFVLLPYDEVILRKSPGFRPNQFVNILGEVKYPGRYALLHNNMTISELVAQAGGFTEAAFVPGATLVRTSDDIGNIIIDLPKAVKQKKTPADLILVSGDQISIPKQSNIVSIMGATNAPLTFTGDLLDNGRLTLAYESGKSVKEYVNSYAGGFAYNADKGKVAVQYPNGEIKKAGRFLFFRTYPEVVPGSIIMVPAKPPKPEPQQGGEDSDVDWGDVLSNSVAQATAVLSLILLIRSLD